MTFLSGALAGTMLSPKAKKKLLWA